MTHVLAHFVFGIPDGESHFGSTAARSSRVLGARMERGAMGEEEERGNIELLCVDGPVDVGNEQHTCRRTCSYVLIKVENSKRTGRW